MAVRNSSGKILREKVQIHPNGCREFWRDIPGLVGKYRVSSWGRVKSLTRNVWNGHVWWKKKGRILKHTTKNAYPSVSLGRRNLVMIHQLVLRAFVGPCPKRMECRHFPDNNKQNNNLWNLRWDTHRRNLLDKVYHGTNKSGKLKGEMHGQHKLTEEMVRFIRTRNKQKNNHAQTAREIFSKWGVVVTKECVGLIARKQSWKHLV